MLSDPVRTKLLRVVLTVLPVIVEVLIDVLEALLAESEAD